MVLFLLTAVILTMLVLIQRGRGGGLAGAFGGPGGHSAFGTKTADVFTKATAIAGGIFFVLSIVTAYAMRPGIETAPAPAPAPAQPGGTETPAPAEKPAAPETGGTEAPARTEPPSGPAGGGPAASAAPAGGAAAPAGGGAAAPETPAAPPAPEKPAG